MSSKSQPSIQALLACRTKPSDNIPRLLLQQAEGGDAEVVPEEAVLGAVDEVLSAAAEVSHAHVPLQCVVTTGLAVRGYVGA